MVLAALAADAQTVLRGKLSDEDGKAVEFADMVLKNMEGKAVSAGISNEKGEFSFDSMVPDATYILEASSVGYVTLTIRTVACDLGELTMPRDIQQLESASVHAQRTVEKAGQFVLVPDPKDVLSSSKGIELLSLQQLPGLKVDLSQNNITIDGGTPVFKINGKEVQLSRLSNLNPQNIKRIEYSNNAGIRYLDRGASGIINIVLKEAEDGGSIYLDAGSAVTTKFQNAYLSGSYNKGKSQFELVHYYSLRDYSKGPSEEYGTYHAPDRDIKVATLQERPLGYLTNNLKFEYTYQVNDSTMFVASLANNMTSPQWSYGNGTKTIIDGGTTSSYDINISRKGSQISPVLDLYYSRSLPKNQKFEINLVGQYNVADNSMETVYSSDSFKESYFVSAKNRGWALTGEAAYSKSFGKVGLRSGVQYQHNLAQNNYEANDIITRMTKDNTYAYVQAEGAAGEKFSWNVGTGAKLFSVVEDGNSKTYLRNLSSLQLNLKINDVLSMSANSSFSPSLPSLADLSPVLLRSDRYEASQGNENLRPANNLNNRIIIRYAGNKGAFLDTYFGYDHTFSPIIETYRYNSDLDVFVSTPENAKVENSLYASFSVGAKRIWDHVDFSVDGLWKREMSKGKDYCIVNKDFSGDINLSANWEKFSFGGAFTYSPCWSLYGEMLISSEKTQYIFARYKMKNLSISVNWLCPLNSKGFYYSSICQSKVYSFQEEHWTVQNGNMVLLNLTWNLNFGKSFRKGSKTLNNGGYDAGIVG